MPSHRKGVTEPLWKTIGHYLVNFLQPSNLTPRYLSKRYAFHSQQKASRSVLSSAVCNLSLLYTHLEIFQMFKCRMDKPKSVWKLITATCKNIYKSCAHEYMYTSKKKLKNQVVEYHIHFHSNKVQKCTKITSILFRHTNICGKTLKKSKGINNTKFKVEKW